MRHWLAAVVVTAGLATAACGRRPMPPAGETPPGPVVSVVMKEWTIEPASLRVREVSVTFSIRNDGVVDHNFAIEGRRDADAGTIKPGEVKTLSVRLEAGTYTTYCNLPGHREAGMVAQLVVAP
jgi:uncharacterized cupredoxin-like copper-binding protein